MHRLGPGRHKIGGWITQDFSKSMIYRGIEWLQTDFSHEGRRTDWVAVLPSGGVSVSYFHQGYESGNWKAGAQEFEHIAQAMDHAMEMRHSNINYQIQESLDKLRAQITTEGMLRKALGLPMSGAE